MAAVLVRYSLAVQQGELVQIVANPCSEPLVREVYRETLLAGAHPLLRFALEDSMALLASYGSDEQLEFVSPMDELEAETVTARLFVQGTAGTRSPAADPDPVKVATRERAQARLRNRVLERAATDGVRWCVTMFPTPAGATVAGMPLSDFEDVVYAAAKVDRVDPVGAWRQVDVEQQQVVATLTGAEEIRILADGTDLRYAPGGRPWTSCAGRHNLPDGEVFTSPDETATEGHVRFTEPAAYGGGRIEDARLVFRGGEVVDATAGRGEDILRTLLDTDEGARRLGEASFGLNYDHVRCTGHVMLDEKVGGTIHLGLGLADPAYGGTNRSALAMYLVADLRPTSEVYADGRLVYRDGRFID